jgi:hypothetical protein
MTEWRALYESHRAVRGQSIRLLSSALRKTLIDLAARGHCDETICGRFRWRHRGAHDEWHIAVPDDREPLWRLPHVKTAHLTLLALVSRKVEQVHQFTAMIDAVTTTGTPWVAAIHLEADHESPEHDRRGSGACGHAAMHCHVGPSMEHEPKVRVPFPAVAPAGALDWLLSTVVPDWEPAPWADVVANLTTIR